mmetsp:Transcript_19242/g.31980  ORF Transcript_19242/g.31980 Transcript_19242/m.31980 type:complete len:242 (-) Transcript_19242:785-1510(-)
MVASLEPGTALRLDGDPRLVTDKTFVALCVTETIGPAADEDWNPSLLLLNTKDIGRCTLRVGTPGNFSTRSTWRAAGTNRTGWSRELAKGILLSLQEILKGRRRLQSSVVAFTVSLQETLEHLTVIRSEFCLFVLFKVLWLCLHVFCHHESLFVECWLLRRWWCLFWLTLSHVLSHHESLLVKTWTGRGRRSLLFPVGFTLLHVLSHHGRFLPTDSRTIVPDAVWCKRVCHAIINHGLHSV